MRSRAPVLAAVAAVAVVDALTARGGGTARLRTTATPDAGDSPSTPDAGDSPSTPLAPAQADGRRTTAAPRRPRTWLAVAAAVGAGVLALPGPLPSADLATAAEATVADEPAGTQAAQERLASERRARAQAQATRARRPPAQGLAARAEGTTPPSEGTPPTPATTPPPPPPPPAPEVVAPVAAPVGSEYGYRWGRLHAGLDFPAPHGTDIVAVVDGVVEQAGPAGGYGNLVTVRHADGTLTAYGHMRRLLVTAGQAVQAGQLIAEVGSEGRSTGPHLHFEVRTPDGTVDPRPWLAERGVPL